MSNPQKETLIFFHLGLPKAASTFLQHQIFPFLDGVTFLRKRKYRMHRDQDFVYGHKSILFSCEMHHFLLEKLVEVSEIYPQARMIFVFREHASWLESKYRYHIRKHGKERFEEYFDPENDKGVLTFERISYQKIIETIYQHFSQPPLFLDYKNLKQNPDQFFQPLYNYLGTKAPESSTKSRRVVKKAFSDKQIRYLLMLNRAYPYQEMKTSVRFINRVHYKYREFLLHTWAFIARFLPGKSTDKDLISAEAKSKIQEVFKEDWEFCLKEIERTNRELREKN